MCNRSNSCHVAASEDEPGWKAGHSVAFCVPCSACSRKSSEIVTEFIQSTSSSSSSSSSSSNSSSVKLSNNKSRNPRSNRNSLTLERKHEIIQFAKDNPTWGYRKRPKEFGVGKTQTITKEKQEILEAYENNQRKGLKRQRSGRYADVNEAVWQWYCLCRSSNIPVSGTMIQEEALVIAEKLHVDGFLTSNGWLERFKNAHNISTMGVAGEEADVSPRRPESWKERSKELIKGWQPENDWNLADTGCFWKRLPDVSLSEKGKRCSGGKQSKQRNTWASFTYIHTLFVL